MSREAQIAERFVGDTREHGVKIVRDDGLYRHVRCMAPETWTYGFDVVTWPGYLAIVGDAGDFVFSRIRDMFDFFESDSGRINPQYWAEKLQAPRGSRAVEIYSEDAARARIGEWMWDLVDGGSVEDHDLEFDEQGPAGGRAAFELWGALREQVLGHELYSGEETHRLLRDFEHDGYRCDDAWEWSMWEYDWQFLWCCHAIVFAIKGYRRIKGPEAQAA